MRSDEYLEGQVFSVSAKRGRCINQRHGEWVKEGLRLRLVGRAGVSDVNLMDVNVVLKIREGSSVSNCPFNPLSRETLDY